MSAEVRTVSGTFKSAKIGGIQTDQAQVLGGGVGKTSRWTLGASFSSPLQSGPTTRQHWSILGWTLRAHIGWTWGVNDLTNGPAPYGRFGDLWAGLLIDSPDTTDIDRAVIPINLSTFTKVWNGETDAIRQTPLPPGTQMTLVAETFMFPTPITAREASQMQMALILTPSLFGISNAGVPDGQVLFFIDDASYTVLYTEEKGY